MEICRPFLLIKDKGQLVETVGGGSCMKRSNLFALISCILATAVLAMKLFFHKFPVGVAIVVLVVSLILGIVARMGDGE